MKKYIAFLAVLAVGIYIYLKRKTILPMSTGAIDIILPFLQNEEKFSPAPYRDYKQWSWGYGTKVPNSDINQPAPALTISRASALLDMVKHMSGDLDTLSSNPAWERLTARQQGVFLSFAYNEGAGAANKMITAWAEDNANFNARYSSYNKVTVNNKLVVSKELMNRRAKELTLFYS